MSEKETPTPPAQRDDFTSEAFKIEIRNIANYGFGVRRTNYIVRLNILIEPQMLCRKSKSS